MQHSNASAHLDRALESYILPPKAQELLENYPSLMISGITAAGKNTLLHALTAETKFGLVLSTTTRPPRMDGGVLEQDGDGYYFVDEEYFLKLLLSGEMFEAKRVHNMAYYGVSTDAFERVVSRGQMPVMETNIESALELKERCSMVRLVFLIPPDFTTWQERMLHRGPMEHEEKLKRMHSAVRELLIALANPKVEIIINDTIQGVVRNIMLPKGRSIQEDVITRQLLTDIRAYLKQEQL
jgi:guanylate kinase